MRRPDTLLDLIIVLGLSTAVLVGCSAKLDVVSKPNEPSTVAVPYAGGRSTASMDISEVCYDGVVYLVNTKGGMSVKFSKPAVAGDRPQPKTCEK